MTPSTLQAAMPHRCLDRLRTALVLLPLLLLWVTVRELRVFIDSGYYLDKCKTLQQPARFRISKTSSNNPSSRLPTTAGDLRIGLLFFAYGAAENETRAYILSTVQPAVLTYKSHNPSLTIALFTSLPSYQDDHFLFDHIVILPESIVPQSHHKKQWLTRLAGLALSPFDISISVDSDTFCCHPLDDLIRAFIDGGYDFAVGSHDPVAQYMGQPDNGVFMFKQASPWLLMHGKWLMETARLGGPTSDDQHTLSRVLHQVVLEGEGKYGRILPAASCRLVPANGEPWPWGPERQHDQTLLLHQAVLILHLGMGPIVQGLQEDWCAWMNAGQSRRRVAVWNHKDGGYPATADQIPISFQMAYKEESCATLLRAPCVAHLGWNHTFSSLIVPFEAQKTSNVSFIVDRFESTYEPST